MRRGLYRILQGFMSQESPCDALIELVKERTNPYEALVDVPNMCIFTKPCKALQ